MKRKDEIINVSDSQLQQFRKIKNAGNEIYMTVIYSLYEYN